MGPVALRSNFSHLYGSTMLPVLEEIFETEFQMYPSLREQLGKMISTDRDIWQSTEIHDLELFQQVSEGEEYSFVAPKQGASKTLTVLKYGLGISISEEAVADGKFDMISAMIRKLARSGKETQEISFMNLFNNGTSTTVATSDGVAWFSTSHTLPSGGTLRNRLSTDADLSPTSLDQGLQDFENQQVGDSGIFNRLIPRTLLVAANSPNKRYAAELLGSSLKADTADNNLNPFLQDGLKSVTDPHITDTDSWCILAGPEDTGIRVVQREAMSTKAADPAVGFLTDSILYKSKYREVLGVIHPYGVMYSAGA